MRNELEKLCKMVRSLPLTEGRNETELSCISVYLSRQRKADLPQTDGFYVYVVLDSSIRFYTPSGILDYLPGQYSVSKIDTPASGHVLTFSEQGDFLALAIELTLNDVISVLLDLDGDLAERIADGGLDSRVTVSADAHVTASIGRLFSFMQDPVPLAFMEKHIRREIIFFILCGSCGSQFLQSVINIQQAGEIYEINSWIKENFRDSFTVEELAEKRNMSVSQFTRDYRKMFGLKPKEDMMKLRSQVERQSRG